MYVENPCRCAKPSQRSAFREDQSELIPGLYFTVAISWIRAVSGSRLDLVARLRTWHDKRQDGKKGQKGNNFAFVKVKEDNLPDRFKSRRALALTVTIQ